MMLARTTAFAVGTQQARPARAARLVVRAEFAPGTKVRVKKSVVIYHAAKRKEGMDLQGMEGVVVADVRQYNGEELSATLPYKTEFTLPPGDNGKPGKVVAHLTDTELEVVS